MGRSKFTWLPLGSQNSTEYTKREEGILAVERLHKYLLQPNVYPHYSTEDQRLLFISPSKIDADALSYMEDLLNPTYMNAVPPHGEYTPDVVMSHRYEDLRGKYARAKELHEAAAHTRVSNSRDEPPPGRQPPPGGPKPAQKGKRNADAPTHIRPAAPGRPAGAKGKKANKTTGARDFENTIENPPVLAAATSSTADEHQASITGLDLPGSVVNGPSKPPQKTVKGKKGESTIDTAHSATNDEAVSVENCAAAPDISKESLDLHVDTFIGCSIEEEKASEPGSIFEESKTGDGTTSQMNRNRSNVEVHQTSKKNNSPDCVAPLRRSGRDKKSTVRFDSSGTQINPSTLVTKDTPGPTLRISVAAVTAARSKARKPSRSSPVDVALDSATANTHQATSHTLESPTLVRQNLITTPKIKLRINNSGNSPIISSTVTLPGSDEETPLEPSTQPMEDRKKKSEDVSSSAHASESRKENQTANRRTSGINKQDFPDRNEAKVDPKKPTMSEGASKRRAEQTKGANQQISRKRKVGTDEDSGSSKKPRQEATEQERVEAQVLATKAAGNRQRAAQNSKRSESGRTVPLLSAQLAQIKEERVRFTALPSGSKTPEMSSDEDSSIALSDPPTPTIEKMGNTKFYSSEVLSRQARQEKRREIEERIKGAQLEYDRLCIETGYEVVDQDVQV